MRNQSVLTMDDINTFVDVMMTERETLFQILNDRTDHCLIIRALISDFVGSYEENEKKAVPYRLERRSFLNNKLDMFSFGSEIKKKKLTKYECKTNNCSPYCN